MLHYLLAEQVDMNVIDTRAFQSVSTPVHNTAPTDGTRLVYSARHRRTSSNTVIMCARTPHSGILSTHRRPLADLPFAQLLTFKSQLFT
jgi:hypothetical protein